MTTARFKSFESPGEEKTTKKPTALPFGALLFPRELLTLRSPQKGRLQGYPIGKKNGRRQEKVYRVFLFVLSHNLSSLGVWPHFACSLRPFFFFCSCYHVRRKSLAHVFRQLATPQVWSRLFIVIQDARGVRSMLRKFMGR